MNSYLKKISYFPSGESIFKKNFTPCKLCSLVEAFLSLLLRSTADKLAKIWVCPGNSKNSDFKNFWQLRDGGFLASYKGQKRLKRMFTICLKSFKMLHRKIILYNEFSCKLSIWNCQDLKDCKWNENLQDCRD